MREKLAILFCAATMLVVVGLCLTFAVRHNPREAAKVALAHPGQKLFEEKACATCHSFAGMGNPRLPLDGIGLRLDEGELREWITGAGSSTNKLSPTIQKRKQRYRSMREEEMRVLIEYLRMGTKRTFFFPTGKYKPTCETIGTRFLPI